MVTVTCIYNRNKRKTSERVNNGVVARIVITAPQKGNNYRSGGGSRRI
jgi:hypothetical protein